MSCLICGSEARVIPALGDYEERICQACGHYRVSGTVMRLTAQNDWSYDIERMRTYIAGQLARSPDEVPVITTVVAEL